MTTPADLQAAQTLLDATRLQALQNLRAAVTAFQTAIDAVDAELSFETSVPSPAKQYVGRVKSTLGMTAGYELNAILAQYGDPTAIAALPPMPGVTTP